MGWNFIFEDRPRGKQPYRVDEFGGLIDQAEYMWQSLDNFDPRRRPTPSRRHLRSCRRPRFWRNRCA